MEPVLAVLTSDGTDVVDGGGLTLSPGDLALVRGEGVFESARIYRGRTFRLAEHLERLARSAAAVGVDLEPLGVAELAARAERAAGGADASLRIFCTKGEGEGAPGLGYALLNAIPEGMEAKRATGLTVTLLPMAVDPLVRAASPWLLPGIKSTSYATNMAAQRAALERGADEAVLVGLGAELMEAPTANIWWRTGDVLYTPSLELGILAGVTRAAVAELAGGCGYRVVEGVFTDADLFGADEAFLSSTVREIMPVVAVDGRTIGDGRPGPAASALQAALRDLALAGQAVPGDAR